ncbi:hypothetical protein JST97_06510 [bacterium]|nr:hypothetical protein [bacterium]
MLKVDYAALADYATDRGGAVTACGLGINQLTVAQVPTTHPQLFLVAQLRDSDISRERRSVHVRLDDPHGVSLSELNGQILFTAIDARQAVARIVLGFYSVQFPGYGDYRFSVRIEQEDLISLVFSVARPA